MRWLCCVLLVTGCLRARVSAIHPTDHERSQQGTGATTTIARGGSPAPDERPPQSARDFTSLEVGALVPLSVVGDATRIHVAPGLRILGSQPGTPLWGLAIGADWSRFALETSLYIGDGKSDPKTVEQALDLFAGVTMRSARASSSISIGPSVGILAMPGGASVVMVGLGLRVQHDTAIH